MKCLWNRVYYSAIETVIAIQCDTCVLAVNSGEGRPYSASVGVGGRARNANET